MTVKEKRGGPFFFRSAINLDLDEDQSSEASFLLDVTAIRLNRLGLERQTSSVSLSLGRVLGTSGEVRVGVLRERREQDLLSGPEDLGGPGGLDGTVDVAGWQVNLSVDRLDSIYFPRSGQLGNLVVVRSRPELGADDRYQLAGLNHVGVKSWGRHTLLSWIELGTSLGDEQPPYAFFGGGGLFSFSGYRRGELFGATYGVVRPTYLYRLATLPTVVGKGIYVGTWLEVGNFWLSRDDASLDDLRYAATVALGAETVIGPAYLAVGLAEDGRRQITLSIGPSFSGRPR